MLQYLSLRFSTLRPRKNCLHFRSDVYPRQNLFLGRGNQICPYQARWDWALVTWNYPGQTLVGIPHQEKHGLDHRPPQNHLSLKYAKEQGNDVEIYLKLN